ncbi:MAG TPA: zf-HC2 domain-containing protein [Acidobacteriota bacterium]|nr:zf-HC2 domain-containing protein [Acidobacteriota bacterium]
MKKCRHEDLIDDYLFNRLSTEKKEEFEEHFFNCPRCFEQIKEKNELISVIKDKGDSIFKDMRIEEESKNRTRNKIFGFLSPKPLISAALTAALVLIIIFGIIPNITNETPEFMMSDDAIRGSSITLISEAIPSEFRWEDLGNNIEYKVFIYNDELLWEKSTQNNTISLPEEIKTKMIPGKSYSWQVKAFSPEGTLISSSSKVQFTWRKNN